MLFVVDLAYPFNLRDIELVNMYGWAPATLSFFYRELNNTTVCKCKYLAVHTTLFQVTKHFVLKINCLLIFISLLFTYFLYRLEFTITSMILGVKFWHAWMECSM
jgi:hypothetical protein